MNNEVGILKEMIVSTLIAVSCYFMGDTERHKQLSHDQTFEIVLEGTIRVMCLSSWKLNAQRVVWIVAD